MYCSKCGREVLSDERFCLACGSQERQQAQPKYGSGWYYLTGGKINVIRGPFSETSMRKMFAEGTLNDNTNIKFGVDALWTRASDVPVFHDVVEEPKTAFKISPLQISMYAFIIILIAGAVVFTKTHSPRDFIKYNEIVLYPVSQKILARETLAHDAIIALTNSARAQNGMRALRENLLLNDVAEERARDMLEKQYFAHVSPTGQQASDIAQRVGYSYKIIAENIGSGDFFTNQKIVNGWMQSPGHRKNILSAEVEEIGAAVLKGKLNGTETYIAVQIFGLESPPVAQNKCVAPSKNLLEDIEIKRAEIEELNSRLQRLKQELEAEQQSIETDRKYTEGNSQKIHNLNVRINALNEKSGWYNRTLADAKAKSLVMESMINDYNSALTVYNDCLQSN
jgi:uncharacterized protein YkwD